MDAHMVMHANIHTCNKTLKLKNTFTCITEACNKIDHTQSWLSAANINTIPV